MLIILFLFVNFFSIEILSAGVSFLNSWLKNEIFQLIFVISCFLFVINGSNLIDGFNGLLIIHFIIITFIYLLINLNNQSTYYIYFFLSQIVIASSILIFNFPKAKVFLGDSGSYVIGSLVALNTIKTFEANFSISPFFFATILFYIFFEVFFSFIRKSIKKNLL